MSFTSLKRALPKATTAFSSSPLLQTTQRRFASAKYAHMKAYKNNWIEQNEIFRENQFYTWSIHAGNIVPILVLAVVAPLTMHYFVKNEHAIREKNAGKAITPRL